MLMISYDLGIRFVNVNQLIRLFNQKSNQNRVYCENEYTCLSKHDLWTKAQLKRKQHICHETHCDDYKLLHPKLDKNEKKKSRPQNARRDQSQKLEHLCFIIHKARISADNFGVVDSNRL